MIPLSISEFTYNINKTFTIMHYTFQQSQDAKINKLDFTKSEPRCHNK